MTQNLTSSSVFYLKESNLLLDFSIPFFATVAGALIAFLLQYFHEKNKERVKLGKRIRMVQYELIMQSEKLLGMKEAIEKELENKNIMNGLAFYFSDLGIKDNLIILVNQDESFCSLLSKSQSNYFDLQEYIKEKNRMILELKNENLEKSNVIKISVNSHKIIDQRILKQVTSIIDMNKELLRKLDKITKKIFKNKWYHYTKVGFIDIKNIKIINFDELDK